MSCPVDDSALVDAAPPPTAAESCMVICAKDPPPAGCQASCESEHEHPGCARETAVQAACIAAGNVVCSVDQESTPVALCGPETRALMECLIAHPPADAGAGDS